MRALVTGIRPRSNVRSFATFRVNIPTSVDPTRRADQQDKLLFTPGPLTTSYTVKKAALRDVGSRDKEFIGIIDEVCSGLLEVAQVSPSKYTVVPVQGSGTFGVESVISSTVPRDGKLLVIANGAYGVRIAQMAKIHQISHTLMEFPEHERPDTEAVRQVLAKDGGAHTHVVVVHSETTSGVVNDIEALGSMTAGFKRTFIVDAMSSFGALPIDFAKSHIHFLISSANKCIEGIPGFSFAICDKAELEKAKGNARSLSLDLYAQRAGLDANKQFRFTPPTHAILAFRQALLELKQEGGVTARHARYRANQEVVQKGLAKLGFQLYLKPELAGCIISSFRFPQDSNWNFQTFYSKLNDLGLVIYPGKVSKEECFRIGHVGRLFPSDSERLVKAIEDVVKEMKTAAFAS